MPISDAVAGPENGDDFYPLNRLSRQVQEIANRALRGEISADEWERQIEEVLKNDR